MRNKFFFYIIFFMLSQNIFSVSFLKDLEFEPLTFDIPEVKVKNLNERLKIYSIHDNEIPIKYFEVKFFVDELMDFSNRSNELLAVLGEVWSFSEDEEKRPFLKQFEYYGTNLSLYTSNDYKTIRLSVEYLDKFEEENFKLLEKLIQKPIFTEEMIQRVKQELIERIKRRNDTILSVTRRKRKELIFKNTKQGTSLQIEKIQSIQKKDLEDYYDSIFKNTRKIVAFVGNWQDDDLYEKFQKLLPFNSKVKLNQKPKITQKSLSKELSQYKFDKLIVDYQNSQSTITAVNILPPQNHKDFYTIKVLNHILGEGSFSSYLGKKIRSDEGLAYSVYSFTSLKKNYGYFVAFAQTKAESTFRTYQLMQEILNQNVIDNISEKDLKRAKDSLINRFIFYFANNVGFLKFYIHLEENNMPSDFFENYKQKISEVTLKKLQRVGKKNFLFGKMKKIIVGRADKFKENFAKKTIVIKPEQRIP